MNKFVNWRSAEADIAAITRALTFSLIKRITSRLFPTVQWITSDELAQWFNDPVKPQPLLLDTRSEAEYAVSHLNQASCIDPVNPTRAKFAGVSKDMPIVVYCSVGYRSARVASRLGQAGFSRVYNLEGSIFKWSNEERPIFRNANPTLLVHPYDPLWGRLLKSRYCVQLTTQVAKPDQ